MQAQKAGFFDRVASPFVRKAVLWSFLGTGAAGYVANGHFNDETRDAQAQGQVLDLKFHELAGKREQEEKLSAVLGKQQQELLAFRSQINREKEELQRELANLQKANLELASELQETQGDLTQAKAERGNLNGRIGSVEATLVSADLRIKQAEENLKAIDTLKDQIAALKEVQDKTITQEVILSVIERSKPSFVTVFEKGNPNAHGSGFITKDIDGNYYIVTCGHMAKNYDELFRGFTIEGFNGAFKFDLIPKPLKDGTVAWHSFKTGDTAFFPLEASQVEEIEKGVKQKFGLNAEVGLKFRAYNETLALGETVIGIGSPAVLTDSVKVTTVGRTGVKRQFNGAIREQEMFEIGHGTTPGESGGPLIGINNRLEPEIVGANTITLQFNRSIGGGTTHNHILRLAALDGINLEDPNNMCTALVDAHDLGLKKGLSLEVVEKARRNASTSPPNFLTALFVIGSSGAVDDVNAEFYTSDLFKPAEKKPLVVDLSLPVLPELFPEPIPELAPSPPIERKPAPPLNLADDVPPPPPEGESIPKVENLEVAPPPPVEK